jgi:hypothetical protein
VLLEKQVQLDHKDQLARQDQQEQLGQQEQQEQQVRLATLDLKVLKVRQARKV